MAMSRIETPYNTFNTWLYQITPTFRIVLDVDTWYAQVFNNELHHGYWVTLQGYESLYEAMKSVKE